MDDASKAVELLVCEDIEEAEKTALKLNQENAHRHEVEEKLIMIFTLLFQRIKLIKQTELLL